MNRLVVADVGSTTTKAILFSKKDRWRYCRHESPTTVEAPHADVTVGLLAALRGLERETGECLVRDDRPDVPLLLTSSAGGGLAMVVTGLVAKVTSRSAERAALGAGAIVLDTVALDDGRVPYRKIEALRSLRPDMLLFAGGFDGEALSGPVLLAELVRQASLSPKLNPEARLPVLYAGNRHARGLVEETLGDSYLFRPVPNLRPESDRENLEPARVAIHEIFMDHVMSHAPGYPTLVEWVDAPILPTPAAMALLLEQVSVSLPGRTLVVDIGGATTDVFTAEAGTVTRTVSANLGMSYSALNVADLAGPRALHELATAADSPEALLDAVGEKYLDPTRLARDEREMEIEWAVATEAIRLAVREHVAVLEGVPISRNEDELSLRSIGRKVRRSRDRIPGELRGYDRVIGSGGILSHSPRAAAASVLLNALAPVGTVELAVDSAFMFPHLGALTRTDPDLAVELFHRLGLVRLGTVVAAEGEVRRAKDRLIVDFPEGRSDTIPGGDLRQTVLGADEALDLKVRAKGLRFPTRAASVRGGPCGVILDARGRPPTRRGLDLIPFDPFRPVARTEEAVTRRVESGPYETVRELAVDGEVQVRPGQTVESTTIVARCVRTFPRPFFLSPATALDVDPEEVEALLLKRPGEDVEVGEVIARGSSGLLRTNWFTSPVAGRIERVLPNGVVMVREATEASMDLRTVEAAKELGLNSWTLAPHVQVEEGQEVEKGQTLARLLRGATLVSSVSPVRGTVDRVDLEFGLILVAPLTAELSIDAWLPGEVVAVSRRGARIGRDAVWMRGAWGWGGEASGALSVDEMGTGRLVAVSKADEDTLAAAAEARVSGLIAGGLPISRLRAAAPPFPVVLTEGFGFKPLTEEFLALLRSRAGQFSLVDATTELRVGVRRPVVVIPD